MVLKLRNHTSQKLLIRMASRATLNRQAGVLDRVLQRVYGREWHGMPEAQHVHSHLQNTVQKFQKDLVGGSLTEWSAATIAALKTARSSLLAEELKGGGPNQSLAPPVGSRLPITRVITGQPIATPSNVASSAPEVSAYDSYAAYAAARKRGRDKESLNALGVPEKKPKRRQIKNGAVPMDSFQQGATASDSKLDYAHPCPPKDPLQDITFNVGGSSGPLLPRMHAPRFRGQTAPPATNRS